MIIRIVQLTFHPDRAADFIELFDKTSHLIRSSDGCRHVELWRHKQYDNIFSTYSLWDSEDHLNRYRASDLFKQIWGETKIWFAAPPVASSFESIRTVD
ncbi:MAG: antibiotic biosynthesis monooxygenase [Bacteroidetes bacterium]|nr:MAG: antibiotic biosynthesis monooxygenase [Bacteroidota bacterium]